ncbi:MAG: LysM peptidoglycan-binding domain-containing protein [Chloroflexi bacterium]|nr:LysM peptidoglycan-binding domain-containing protein [Chloroflexota bacterium]
MKHIRFSPWLILVLAVVLVFAAGCDRPDPQVAIDTPQPMNVPQQPVGPQGETPAPGGESNAPDGAATPTLPAVVVATSESVTEGTPVPGGQEVPQISPTVVPPQPTPQPTPQVQPTAQVNAQGNTIHTVKAGETLFSIGRLYNVNPYSLAAVNNLPYPYIIYPGQQLTISTGAPPPGPTPVPPQSGKCRYYHTVKPGENLYRISLAYGVPMATIASANGIVNYNLIYAGQTLCIP